MLDRREILRGMSLGGLGFIVVPAFAQTEAGAVGTVADVEGSATARKGGEPRVLGAGQHVFAGERLQTGGDSKLRAALGAATQLFMGANTRVTIDGNLVQRGGIIKLGSGALMFERRDPDPKPEVAIHSPYARLAVRGTSVFAGPSNGVFGVFVSHGEVVVTNAGGSVTLRPGEGTNIARPGAKPTPAAAWGDARINDAMRSVR